MKFFKRKYTLKSSVFIIYFSIFNLIYNIGFFQYLGLHYEDNLRGKVIFLLSFILFILCLFNILFHLLLTKKVARFNIPILLINNSLCLYFMTRYHVMVDKSMLVNIFETNFQEALEFMNFELLLFVLLLGFLPSFFFLSRFNIIHQPIKSKIMNISASFILILSLFFGLNKEYSSFLRSHREIKHLLVPINYLDALKVFYKGNKKNHRLEEITSGTKLSFNWKAIHKKTIFFLVIGETARAQNFSLNNHFHETNPLLKKTENLVSFKNVYSCGTSTANSLPCMFSDLPKGQFSEKSNRENLLDVVKKAGFEVVWIDNNSGCKGVCVRVENKKTSGYDFKMLDGLSDIISQHGEKILLVFHQLGSHGPTYFKRYPKRFAKFKPECRTEKLNTCSKEEIINTYDNTILLTDYFLYSLIQNLKTYSNANTAMLYISDHGESLGENNLYLHGLPYWLAPEEQKHIPLIFWSSKNYTSDFHLNLECLKKQTHQKISHDNLFHSMLGALEIDNPKYQKEFDLFRSCKTHFNRQARL